MVVDEVGRIGSFSTWILVEIAVHPGSVYDVPLNPIQAMAGRDALAKAIYNNLFEWIVSRVNVSMKPRTAHSHLIGVLDIYGFEIFQVSKPPSLISQYATNILPVG